MTPTLFHVPRTISSPIYQALLELEVPPSEVEVATLTFGDLKTPEHLKRNPMGTSPTYTDEDKGIAIWESGAVLTFLFSQHDRDYKLHPNPATAAPADYAKFLHLQQYLLATVYPFLATLIIHTLKPKEEQDDNYVETSKRTWKTLMAPTLKKCLGDSDYFMGQSMSAIDLLAAKPLNNAHSMGLLAEFPTLHKVFHRIHCLPSFSKAYGGKRTSHCLECRSFIFVPGQKDADRS